MHSLQCCIFALVESSLIFKITDHFLLFETLPFLVFSVIFVKLSSIWLNISDDSSQDTYALPIFLLFKTLSLSIPPKHHHFQPCNYNCLYQDVPWPPQMQYACNRIPVAPHADSLWDAPPTIRGIVTSRYSCSEPGSHPGILILSVPSY